MDSTTTSTTTQPLQQQPSSSSSLRLNVFEKAKTVTTLCTSGTLCTISNHQGIQGAPFGSYVDYVLDDQGNPVLLLHQMAMHTQNIFHQQQKSTDSIDNIDNTSTGPSLVTLFTQFSSLQMEDSNDSTSSNNNNNNNNKRRGNDNQQQQQQQQQHRYSTTMGQTVGRCSLVCKVEPIDASTALDWDILRMRYSLTHSSYADQVMDSPKFQFMRLIPQEIYYMGGFGVMAQWISVSEYRKASPDILARESSQMIRSLNTQMESQQDLEHVANYLLLPFSQATTTTTSSSSLQSVRVTNIDRLGMDIRVTRQTGTRRNKLVTDEYRIGFRIPVQSVEDAKSEIQMIFQEAWEKGQGMDWGENDQEQPGSTVPIVQIAADSLE